MRSIPSNFNPYPLICWLFLLTFEGGSRLSLRDHRVYRILIRTMPTLPSFRSLGSHEHKDQNLTPLPRLTLCPSDDRDPPPLPLLLTSSSDAIFFFGGGSMSVAERRGEAVLPRLEQEIGHRD